MNNYVWQLIILESFISMLSDAKIIQICLIFKFSASTQSFGTFQASHRLNFKFFFLFRNLFEWIFN